MRILDLERVAPPEAEAVSLAEAKAHLVVEHVLDDDIIDGMRLAAIGHLDGYTGILGRALVAQTWELHLEAFPSCGEIRLPLPPLLEVVSIAYVDPQGVERTLAPEAYQVLAGRRAGVRPAYGARFPATRCQARAVTITYRCGLCDDPSDLPGGIRPAILLMIGDLYANRESAQVGSVASSIPMSATVERLLAPYRLPRL